MLSELLDVPIQIFHVSCEEAAEEIRRAQQRGLKIFSEISWGKYLDKFLCSE